VFACSIVAPESARCIAKGDGRRDGAEALRLSAAGEAGQGADPRPGDLSGADTVGAKGGLLLEADLCLPPR
jgi:hypothetical protein